MSIAAGIPGSTPKSVLDTEAKYGVLYALSAADRAYMKPIFAFALLSLVQILVELI